MFEPRLSRRVQAAWPLALLLVVLPADRAASISPEPATSPPLNELERSVRDLIRRRGFWCAGRVTVSPTQGDVSERHTRATCDDGRDKAVYDVVIDPSGLRVVEVW